MRYSTVSKFAKLDVLEFDLSCYLFYYNFWIVRDVFRQIGMKIHGWKIGFLDSPVAHSTLRPVKSCCTFLCALWTGTLLLSRHGTRALCLHSVCASLTASVS
jgi:hypothetical protein